MNRSQGDACTFSPSACPLLLSALTVSLSLLTAQRIHHLCSAGHTISIALPSLPSLTLSSHSPTSLPPSHSHFSHSHLPHPTPCQHSPATHCAAATLLTFVRGRPAWSKDILEAIKHGHGGVIAASRALVDSEVQHFQIVEAVTHGLVKGRGGGISVGLGFGDAVLDIACCVFDAKAACCVVSRE